MYIFWFALILCLFECFDLWDLMGFFFVYIIHLFVIILSFFLHCTNAIIWNFMISQKKESLLII